MDPVDYDFVLTKDDEQARRIASLALAFMSSDFIQDEIIWRSFYPDLEKADSYRAAFRRDRAALAECGITVTRSDGPETLWHADDASFVENTELSEEDAMALDVACLPLVDDPDFPYGAELRIALSKIDSSFDTPFSVALPTEDRLSSRQLATLRGCSLTGHAARIAYTRADGSSLERLVAPYGFFGMRGHLYLVAPSVGEAGEVIDGSTRTYRIDRVGRATEVPSTHFEVPEDFDVRDWQKLPFQIGPTVCEAAFSIPACADQETIRATQGRGTLEREPLETSSAVPNERAAERTPANEFPGAPSRTTWLVAVSNVEDAASWAIAEGLTPLSPPELVEVWRTKLEEVVSHG